MIVTICGSTKFKDQMFEVAKELTLEGHIVLMPLVFAHQGDIITEREKLMLDRLHQEKIGMSELVAIVAIDKYIGTSTRNEINYAVLHNKNIVMYNYSSIKPGVNQREKLLNMYITKLDVDFI